MITQRTFHSFHRYTWTVKLFGSLINPSNTCAVTISASNIHSKSKFPIKTITLCCCFQSFKLSTFIMIPEIKSACSCLILRYAAIGYITSTEITSTFCVSSSFFYSFVKLQFQPVYTLTRCVSNHTQNFYILDNIRHILFCSLTRMAAIIFTPSK